MATNPKCSRHTGTASVGDGLLSGIQVPSPHTSVQPRNGVSIPLAVELRSPVLLFFCYSFFQRLGDAYGIDIPLPFLDVIVKPLDSRGNLSS
jgi:hypothetical protein